MRTSIEFAGSIHDKSIARLKCNLGLEHGFPFTTTRNGAASASLVRSAFGSADQKFWSFELDLRIFAPIHLQGRLHKKIYMERLRIHR